MDLTNDLIQISRKQKIIGPILPQEFDKVDISLTETTLKSPKVDSKRVFGPTKPEETYVNDKSKTQSLRNRSKSPPPSSKPLFQDSNPHKANSRESWMTEIGEENVVQKIGISISYSYFPNFKFLDHLNIKSRTFIQRKTLSLRESAKIMPESIDPDIKVKEKDLDDQIKEYNDSHRSKTLQEIYEEEHMSKKKSITEIDEKERIFDWERDMNSTVRRMSSKSAKDLMKKSSLVDRFNSSSNKKYL